MIVGVTGHQAMPPAARAYVVTRLRQLLGELPRPVTGLSSLAAGADQLFAEAVLESGATLHAVLPARRYESTFNDAEDRRRYQTLLTRAAAVDILPFDYPSENAFFEAGKRIADRADLLIAVWDGEPARGSDRRHRGRGAVRRRARASDAGTVARRPETVIRVLHRAALRRVPGGARPARRDERRRLGSAARGGMAISPSRRGAADERTARRSRVVFRTAKVRPMRVGSEIATATGAPGLEPR